MKHVRIILEMLPLIFIAMVILLILIALYRLFGPPVGNIVIPR